MKLGFLSDLHLDHNQAHFEADLLERLIRHIQKAGLDYLFVSGDISSDAWKTLAIVERINGETRTKTYFVPGNHDVWRKDKDSIGSLRSLGASKYAITDQALELNDRWTVIGSFPWYDYSLETEGMPQDFYRTANLWPDARFTDWQMDDPAFSVLQLDKTEEIIRKVPSDKKIIMIQHFVPHKDFLVIKPGRRSWNLCNAYMGTASIGQLCLQYPNIKMVTLGHTHHRFGAVEKSGVAFLGNPLGYVHEWQTSDFAKELETCLLIKEI
jgi:putative phosphoesterase